MNICRRSRSNKSRSKSNKRRSKSNKRRSRSNKRRSKSNKRRSRSNKRRSRSNKRISKSNKLRSKNKVKKNIDGMTSFEEFGRTHLSSEVVDPCTNLFGDSDENLLAKSILTDNPKIVHYVINLCRNTRTMITQKNNMNTSILQYACDQKNFEIFKMIYDLYVSENLIDEYINILNENGTTPFMYSVGAGNLEIVKFLLENNRDNIRINQLDNMGDIAIMYAKNYEVIKFLVENGSLINIENEYGSRLIDKIVSYSLIAIGEKVKIIDYLLENGSTITNSKERNLIMVACKRLDIEILQFLLGKQLMDINAQDNDGNTALIYCLNSVKPPTFIKKNIYNVIKLLLDSGADDTIDNYIDSYATKTFMSIGNRKFTDFEEKIKEIKRLRDIEYISHLYSIAQDNSSNFFNEYISTVKDPGYLFEEIMKFK